MSSTLPQLVLLHKALAHAARLRILAMLRHGELCVCQITTVLGLAASTVSAHLKELRNAGLTVERKEGKWVKISLTGGEIPGTALETVLDRLVEDPRIIADDQLVAELRNIPVETLCRSGLEAARDQIQPQSPARADPSSKRASNGPEV